MSLFFQKTPSDKKRHGILPGFGLSMGITVLYLSILVLIPLISLFFKAAGINPDSFAKQLLSPRVLSAFSISIRTSVYAAFFDGIFGLLVAWTLVRYNFPGKKIIDSLIDLPFALPTAVAGIALTTLYSQNGWIGKFLEPLGLKVAYTPLGISLALAFIGFPFVVRSIQPVLEECSSDIEQAAANLGAPPLVIFYRVILPQIIPAIFTGAALAFSRGLGEYGSIVFISGNMPLKTEIVPLLIMTKLEQFDYITASAIALVFLLISFLIVFMINLLQWHSRRKYGEI
ncbi:MAG TPA: sulfate ABC transporter permease subunit CysT [Chitinispirillaceae bacterium]|nr:sulfate ABC transporter permease subunit CysT [Chitinispirillaceae bacterium]